MNNVLGRALAAAARWGVRDDAERSDGERVRLHVRGRGERTYRAVVRDQLPPRLARSTPLPERDALVLAPYIGPAAGEALRARGADYLDATGAAHLEWDGLLIHTDSPGRPQKHPRPPSLGDARSRVYARAGQKVVLVLLGWPEVRSAPLRTIAASAGVSLGSAHKVVDAMVALDHLVADAGGRRLARGAELLSRWTDAYVVGIGRDLTLGRFTAPDPLWWRDAVEDLAAHGVQVGGEAAVSLLDPWLSPRTLTLYADELPVPVLAGHRLRRDDDGPVELRRRFWTLPAGAEPDPLTPAALVYADLMASGDPRQHDAAARLRETDARLVDIDRS